MKSKLLLVFILLFSGIQASAQDEHEARVRDVVSFLEYVLNTLGNPSTSARDKDVIVNQSYLKIFRDSTVQVEDDLDENRDVVTNKDVQAYLKDVDFFFTSAKFTFEWQELEVSENQDGNTFYKVSLLRNLEAYSVMGDTINQTLPRYIEINVDDEQDDLKIASIYTNELNQDAIWTDWWNALSVEWQSIFRRKMDLNEDPTLEEIKSLDKLDSLDLSGNLHLIDIEALNQIRGLRFLDISNTNINDLTPIRNLTGLRYLDISNTGVTSIEGLRYAKSLEIFKLEGAPVADISVISRMQDLEEINLSRTFAHNLHPITNLRKLRHLELENTDIASFDAVDSVTSLKYLNIDGTDLVTLNQLSNLNKLEFLFADSTQLLNLDGINAMPALMQVSLNQTRVTDLTPALELESLNRIYCDYSGITPEHALEFRQQRPSVLIIFESEEMIHWWNDLDEQWKNIFANHVSIASDVPSREELARIEQLSEVDLGENAGISSLDPLNKILNLQKLNASGTSVSSLDALVILEELTEVSLINTMVEDFSPLASLKKLSRIHADNVPASNLSSLNELPNLDELHLDNSGVSDTAIIRFARLHPEALIIFKTDRLSSWWNQLTADWQEAFRSQTELSAEPTTHELHTLIGLSAVNFQNVSLYEINPLKEFIRLRELEIVNTNIRNFGPLHFLDYLERLNISRNPVESLDGITSLKELKELDISNTPITDLSLLDPLRELEKLNCSGTQIKSLRGLANLTRLASLDCSNTAIKKLDEVNSLSLQSLQCYNTRISSKRIDGFKQLNPECDVSYY